MVVPPTALNLLRAALRTRRKHFASGQKNGPLAAAPILDAVLAGAQIVGIYHAIGGEPDPIALIGNLRGQMALPFLTTHDTLMTFRQWEPGDPLVKSHWGGQQPVESAPQVKPDLIFVPLLGFDLALNRIGQGGGHYDRYLAANPSACRIGIAWECQRIAEIESQPWDVPLDAILTETAFHIKDLTRCHHL